MLYKYTIWLKDEYIKENIVEADRLEIEDRVAKFLKQGFGDDAEILVAYNMDDVIRVQKIGL